MCAANLFRVLTALCLACKQFAPVAIGQLGQASTLVPLARAHAHNDYEHTRPLLDALAHGFCSIEADVHLVGDKLLVAHDPRDTKPERSLEALYLEPLRARARGNGGRIYPNGPSVILPTYLALDPVLSRFADILTRFEDGRIESNAVTVIISGNRARDLMARQKLRYAALDGRLSDLQASESAGLIPLISDDWKAHFQWHGDGNLPAEEEIKLRKIITLAHEQKRKVRFWGTPDRVEFWRALSHAGVDLINADDLKGLQAFLLSQSLRH